MQFGAQDRRRLTDIGRGGMKPGISHWDLKKEGKGQNVEHRTVHVSHAHCSWQDYISVSMKCKPL